MLNRKGQEEIVGFVLVVVIVTVVAMILIGLALRGEKPEELKSIDIHYFLESMFYTTSPCELQVQGVKSPLSDVLVACYRDRERQCKQGGDVCSVLKSSVESMLESGWHAGVNASLKGYVLESVYAARNSSESEKVFSLEKGNCTGAYMADEYLLREPQSRGTITTTLKIC